MNDGESLRQKLPASSLCHQLLSVSISAASLNIGFFTCYICWRSSVPPNISIALRDVWIPIMLFTGLLLTATAGVLAASRLSGSRLIYYACATVVITSVAVIYGFICVHFPADLGSLSTPLGELMFKKWLLACVAISVLSAMLACVLLLAGKGGKRYLRLRLRRRTESNAV